MVAANPGVDPWLPGVGTEVIIPTRFVLPPGPREGVVINLAEYRLYYYPKAERGAHLSAGHRPRGLGFADREHPHHRQDQGPGLVSAGLDPRRARRRWRSAATVVPPGPDNPLGPYKLTLGVPGYLIHGSNKKFGIGTRTSHGCFRMYNADVTHLFSMISVGTSVRIINEPYKFGVSNGKVYLEAHTPLNDHGDPSVVDKHTAVINTLLKRDDLAKRIQLNWDVVREVVASEDGVPVEIAQESAPAMTATVDSDPTQLTP